MNGLEIFDCEQNSPEWYQCRLGIPTASEFATVMASGRGGGESKTRRTYMLKLMGERMTGEPMESFSNVHTERGKAMEQEARDMYTFVTDAEPVRVGFVRRPHGQGLIGASPDSLLGDDGLLEIKTRLPHLQLDLLMEDRLPPEHLAQVQGQLWVTGRRYVDFVSFWPKLPLYRLRVERDEQYIATLADSVARFENELRTLAKNFE